MAVGAFGGASAADPCGLADRAPRNPLETAIMAAHENQIFLYRDVFIRSPYLASRDTGPRFTGQAVVYIISARRMAPRPKAKAQLQMSRRAADVS